MTKTPAGNDSRAAQARQREERLAEALRANLQRRKLQARSRGPEATPDVEWPHGPALKS